jgi:hypothetical protein
VQPRVAALLAGRLLVGHALRNDLKALLLSHPRRLIRDTATYVPLMRAAPHVGGPTAAARRGRSAKLKDLAAAHLGLTIQSGEHSPVEDARAALLLYQRYAKEWEASLTSRGKAAALAVKSRRSGAGLGIAGMGTNSGAEGAAGRAEAEEELRGAAARRAKKKERRAAVNRPRVEAPERGAGGGGWSAVLSRAAHGGGGGAALAAAAAAQQQQGRQQQGQQQRAPGAHTSGGGVVAAAWRRHAATAAALGATAPRGKPAGGASGGGASRARNGLQLFTSE